MSNRLLTVEHLSKSFPRRDGSRQEAVRDVSFQLEQGETLGIVGGSGSGKSTLARLVTRLIAPDAGRILLAGQDITRLKGRPLRQVQCRMQMVFQSPAGSFDPRQTLVHAVAEPLCCQGMPRRLAVGRARSLLEQCGLPADLADRRPGQVSGGQCQRAAIARALTIGPRLLVCDEATSALDATVQQQILDLLRQLRSQCGLAFLFICHDLAVVQQFCDRVLVLYGGRMVEDGPVAEVLAHPRNAYTRALIDAAW